jgi:hypothetical protein
MTFGFKKMRWLILIGGVVAMIASAPAAILSLSTNSIGATPEILAYNSGHFLTNSNTKDWWRYAGVNGARVFLSPSEIEPSDDISPVGDGVNSQGTFLSRQAALRADPLNLSYINWAGSSVFSNRYENNDLYPNNHIKPNYTFREMRKLGIQICAQITASESRLPIASATDWPNMWELWQHYYAQAFYLGRVFDVERYQMFNEPNHPNANGLTIANHLLRLQLVSDAVQSALADVNALYGKSLSPKILAAVTSGSAAGSYPGWGESVVTNRHLNFLGQTDTNFSLIHVYDYHQYNSSPSGFGTSLATLHSLLTAEMSPAPRYPTSISEFNSRTGATFDTMTETLDTPSEYARFGAICVNLLANACAEFYCFKFSQTERDPPTAYPVAKNAMHYVDNASSPYNVGGITKAGEVYRLFNKAFATGRSRLNTTKGGDATSFDVHASYDPVRKRYHLFSVNNTASGVTIELALSSLPVPVGNRVLLEEVSESTYGGGKLWTSVPANKTIAAGSQDSNTVWLLTVPVEPQAAEQILAATDDAEVRDGSNKNNNYGGSTAMTARNDPANTANRSAAFLKFNLGGIALTNIEFALLSLQAASATTNATAQAHVYALDATNWAQGAITWAAAPNLKQNVTAGNTIAKQCVTGAGDSAFIMGQVVVNSTNTSERLLDVTDWLRARTNSAVSFLVAQDPRWDVELPSLATGDTQPDGVMILTTESGNGPRLRIVLKSAGGPVNIPPVATNDVYAATEDTPLVVHAPGVLANDFDAETNALTAVLVANATNGIVTLNPNGGFTYTPNTNYFGPDAFTYQANDGAADSGIATVAINVASVNDAPFAVNDAVTTTQNTPVVVSVLANDSDVDGGTLTIVSFTQAASGSVSNNGNGTLTYLPGLNFTGGDAFNYTITDNQGGTNSASVSITVNPVGGTPYWTNLLVATEAVVRGGTSAALDVDEIATGYLMMKYNAAPFDAARKAYFQFELTGLNLVANTQAVFTVGFLNTFKQNAQLWALNQAYTNFTSALTWNTAQANDTASNNLLSGGALNATTIGPVTNLPASSTTPVSLAIPNIGNYLLSNRLTLVLSGSPDAGSFTNNASGLRMLRTNATLQVLVIPPAPPVSYQPPLITSIIANPDGSITMSFSGATNRTHWLQANTNLATGSWVNISTNVSSGNGAWSVTDSGSTNFQQRFYRAVLP